MGTNRAVKVSMVACALAGAVLAGCTSDDGDGASKTTTTKVAAPVKADDSLRLNEIQVIGTHNSFHVAAPDDEMAKLTALDAEQAAQRTYSHPSLARQLGDQKIRQIELDVFADSKGGLYSNPALRDPKSAPTGKTVMDEPGTKVMHEQDVDYHSNCPTLVDCLSAVKAWSDANPDHVPVAINIQFKDGPLIFDVPTQAKPEKWTTEAMDGLDAEITSVFDGDDLITPDDVRGDRPTLNEAVLRDGWPTLGESRGKVMFLMINPEPYRSIYLEGHEGLKDRILFTNAEPGQPDASYIGLDDPVADGARITELVEQGYLVRTRSDANGVEPEANDTTRLDKALASGAQWISTDYPGPKGAEAAYDTDFLGQLPGFLAARCNPVSAPKRCQDRAVEP